MEPRQALSPAACKLSQPKLCRCPISRGTLLWYKPPAPRLCNGYGAIALDGSGPLSFCRSSLIELIFSVGPCHPIPRVRDVAYVDWRRVSHDRACYQRRHQSSPAPPHCQRFGTAALTNAASSACRSRRSAYGIDKVHELSRIPGGGYDGPRRHAGRGRAARLDGARRVAAVPARRSSPVWRLYRMPRGVAC